MSTLDELWNFDDPAASETRFRDAIAAAEATGDPDALATADEARTQLARSLGLQGRFAEGDAILDALDAAANVGAAGAVDTAHSAKGRIRVRAHLERGRLRRSGGDPAAAAPHIEAAWALARTLGEDGLAVDAAHMLALVDAAPGEATWHERALDLADTSPDPAARKWRGSLWNNIGWARFGASDVDGALVAFETALEARRGQGQAKETRVAEWCVARALRALGKPDEALAIQERLVTETAAAGDAEDGYMSEEIAECLLELGRHAEATPHFARAADLLGADTWLTAQEPERIDRLRALGAAGRGDR